MGTDSTGLPLPGTPLGPRHGGDQPPARPGTPLGPRLKAPVPRRAGGTAGEGRRSAGRWPRAGLT